MGQVESLWTAFSRQNRRGISSRTVLVHAPELFASTTAQAVASRVCGETILTYDELRRLARNGLDSTQPVLGTISLLAWLEESGGEVGLRFAREPGRGGRNAEKYALKSS